MAFVPYHNITGSTGVTTELIQVGSKSGAIEERDGIAFNNNVFGMFVTVGGADTVDILISK